jgi:hypothetical protein
MDYLVKRFSRALERYEDNRKALLKWIQGNLQAGMNFGQIHVVKRKKCRLAKECQPISVSTRGTGFSLHWQVSDKKLLAVPMTRKSDFYSPDLVISIAPTKRRVLA